MTADLAQARETIRRCREIRDSGKVEAVLRGEFQSRLRLIFPAPDDEAWINHYSEGTEAHTMVGQAGGGIASRFIDNLIGSTTSNTRPTCAFRQSAMKVLRRYAITQPV